MPPQSVWYFRVEHSCVSECDFLLPYVSGKWAVLPLFDLTESVLVTCVSSCAARGTEILSLGLILPHMQHWILHERFCTHSSQ